MKGYLKHYRIRITALSPIYVGDGKLIGKKEYIRRNRRSRGWGTVEIPDPRKMLICLRLLSCVQDFENYMLDQGGNVPDLYQWLQAQGISEATISSWIRYSMDAGDVFIGPRNGRNKGIESFQKDAYGKPYIPGSSIKGMLRTALLAWELGKQRESNSGIEKRVRRAVEGGRGKGDAFLRNQAEDLEVKVFHRPERNKENLKDAVNSVMAGLIVGDSDTISEKQLLLCQKIDYSCIGDKKKERAFPILREALKPGTEVFFDLSIDETTFPYRIEDIFAALDFFQELCYERFYKRFGRGRKESGLVWLGGGVGFLSKTVVYALFSPEDALYVTDQVFKKTVKTYKEHKHGNDLRLGISPHVCKCTRYQGELCDMGMGRIELLRGV